MKNRTVILLGLGGLSMVIMLLIYIKEQQRAGRKNGFYRRIISGVIQDTGYKWQLERSRWYIAGLTQQHLFIASSDAFNYLLKVDMQAPAKGRQQIYIRKKENRHGPMPGATLFVTGPKFFIIDGHQPAVFKGDTINWMINTIDTPAASFDSGLLLSDTTMIVRALNNKGLSIGRLEPDRLHLSHILPDKNMNGIMEMDGTMCYQPSVSRFVYTYYYRNSFVVCDAALHVLFKKNTIDTIAYPQINVSQPDRFGEIRLSSSPIVTNRRSAVSQEYLFIQSGLMADNEDRNVYQRSVVFDVYHLTDGNYICSFYIPAPYRKKLFDFRVTDSRLMVLYEDALVVYQLKMQAIR